MKDIQTIQNYPIAFAQVREDPEQDLAALRESASPADIIMVASGGCTAALICCAYTCNSIHLVDPNPAQLCLAHSKILSLLEPPELRQELFCAHAPDTVRAFFNQHGLQLEVLGPLTGPINQIGRYELLFERLRENLRQQDIQLLPELKNCKQGTLDTRLINAIKQAFEDEFALDKLVALFGPEACNNPRKSFSEHFTDQTIACIKDNRWLGNYFFEDMFQGRYTELPGWLLNKALENFPPLEFHQHEMLHYLSQREDNSADFIHLSNILDWLDHSEAKLLINETERVLRPGGRCIIRQLNSTLPIESFFCRLKTVTSPVALADKDCSFFYRKVFVAKLC